jgi:hypothetical protein
MLNKHWTKTLLADPLLARQSLEAGTLVLQKNELTP